MCQALLLQISILTHLFFIFTDRVRQNVARSQSRTRNNISNNNNNGRRNGNQRGPNRPRNQQTQRGGKQARGRSQKKIGMFAVAYYIYLIGKQINSILRNFFFCVAVKREPPKSKEQLDAELDQYMVNTKSSLDQEMSIYTK